MTRRGRASQPERTDQAKPSAGPVQDEAIAAKLRMVYGTYLNDPVPPELEALIRRLADQDPPKRPDDK